MSWCGKSAPDPRSVALSMVVHQPAFRITPAASSWASWVLHPKFGEGVVLNAEGQGGSARVQVNFEQAGAKWLVVAYANLQPI